MRSFLGDDMKLDNFLLCALFLPVAACGTDDDDTGGAPTTHADTESGDDTTTDDPSGTTDAPSSTTDDPSDTTDDPTTDPTTDTPTDDTGETSDDMGDTEDTEDTSSALSFQDAVWPILDASCSCHKTATGRAGLALSAANAYGNLVGVPSTQDANFDRVEPFAPSDSYMLQKLTNTHQTATQSMPPGGMLSQTQLDTIEQWIDEGAEP
jgi:hypothetical protein